MSSITGISDDDLSAHLMLFTQQVMATGQPVHLEVLKEAWGSLSVAKIASSWVFLDILGYCALALGSADGKALDLAEQVFIASRSLQMQRRVTAVKETVIPRLRAVMHAESFAVDRSVIEGIFEAFCDAHGITRLRTLRAVAAADETHSAVFLCRNSGGVDEVFKEIRDYTDKAFSPDREGEDRRWNSLPPHPFLPAYHGLCTVGPYRFMRFALSQGADLSAYRSVDSRLPPNTVYRIIAQVADALAFLHSFGLAHFDVRPENILFREDGVTLLDLGDARRMPVGLPFISAFLGDPTYAVPEIVTDFRGGFRADVFQLGVIAHQLLTGRHPFCVCPEMGDGSGPGGGHYGTMVLKYAVPTALVPYVADLAHEFDNPGLAIIPRMLAKDPVDRPSMAEVAARFSSLTD